MTTHTIKTKLKCAWCRKDWTREGSPGVCPKCGKTTYAVVVVDRNTN